LLAPPQELDKFNAFFIEKEETLVILGHALSERATSLLSRADTSPAELASLCQRLARFHGELVLLEHWCSLNYAALVKILKKARAHGHLLSLPLITAPAARQALLARPARAGADERAAAALLLHRRAHLARALR